MKRRFIPTLRRIYGAAPWTLPVLLACFALTAYAANKVIGQPQALRMFGWFIGAALVHDFLLFPVYSGVDRGWQLLLRRLPHVRSDRSAGVPVVNHVRVPAALAGLLLLIYAPTIFGRGTRVYRAASGLGSAAYLSRWLLLTGSFFLLSGLIYALRVLRARRSASPPRVRSIPHDTNGKEAL